MVCQVVHSQSQVQSRLPTLPQQLPQTQQDWNAVLTTLNQWGSILQQASHAPNIIPSQFQTFTITAAVAVIAALSVSNCTPSVDNTEQYYGGASLKTVISATGATLQFAGFPISIAGGTRWFCSFQILAPSGCTASLTVATSAGHSITESFTVQSSASWQQVWGLFDLRQYADTQATWRFTFTSTATVWLDGMQMNAVGSPIGVLPKFAGTQMVTGALAYASNLDGVPDGTTYERMPGANMDANRRGLIDWSSAGHINGVGSLTVRGNCTVSASGTVVTKSGGVNGWDSDASAVQAYQNGCFLSFRASANHVMVGFSLDPTSSTNYTSIDYGIEIDPTTGDMWRFVKSTSDNTLMYSSGVSANDAWEMRYDGVTMRWFRNGSLIYAIRAVGLKLYPKVCCYSAGAVVSNFEFGPASAVNQPSGSWINTYPWVIGATGSQGNFSDIAGGTASQIYIAGTGTPLGPYGTSEPLWVSSGGVNGPNGGWNNSGDLYGIDPTKTYRSSVWFYWNGVGNPQFYHGCEQSAYSCTVGTQSVASNPYFHDLSLSGHLTAGKWYLSVGILHGSGYTGGNTNIGGIYDPSTGQRVLSGTDYNILAGAPYQEQRVYHYYDTGGSGAWMAFAKPRFEEVNGNEPSVQALLAPAYGALAFANNLDGVPDGSTYARFLASGLSGNIATTNGLVANAVTAIYTATLSTNRNLTVTSTAQQLLSLSLPAGLLNYYLLVLVSGSWNIPSSAALTYQAQYGITFNTTDIGSQLIAGSDPGVGASLGGALTDQKFFQITTNSAQTVYLEANQLFPSSSNNIVFLAGVTLTAMVFKR